MCCTLLIFLWLAVLEFYHAILWVSLDYNTECEADSIVVEGAAINLSMKSWKLGAMIPTAIVGLYTFLLERSYQGKV